MPTVAPYNTDSLALQNIGLETDSRGQLKVNSMYQTAQPHVYAVGDVIGYPSPHQRPMTVGALPRRRW